MIYACSLLLVVGAGLFLSYTMTPRNNINISLSETDEQLTFSASFPVEDTRSVHDYVKSKLKMTDLTDLRHLEIKKYETPDQKMRFHLLASAGRIKIILDRRENGPEAYRKIKIISEGVKRVVVEKRVDVIR